MNKFMTTSLSSALLLSAFLMTGCGGGGDNRDGGSDGTVFDGNTSPAAIDIDNAKAIGTASGEAVQKASAPTGLPSSISVSTSSDLDRINEIILSTADILSIPAASDASAACDGGGSAHVSDTPTIPTSGPLRITITYDMCVISFGGDSNTFDGTVTLDYEDIDNPNAGFVITYSNFRVTDSSGTITINLTVNCSDLNNCIYSSDFVGSDGATHRVTDSSVSGNASSGYNGSATFLHGTYGEVSITISGITYSSSCGAIPSGGTVNFTSGNPITSSGSITFNSDCTVSGTWSNSSGSGSF